MRRDLSADLWERESFEYGKRGFRMGVVDRGVITRELTGRSGIRQFLQVIERQKHLISFMYLFFERDP